MPMRQQGQQRRRRLSVGAATAVAAVAAAAAAAEGFKAPQSLAAAVAASSAGGVRGSAGRQTQSSGCCYGGRSSSSCSSSRVVDDLGWRMLQQPQQRRGLCFSLAGVAVGGDWRAATIRRQRRPTLHTSRIGDASRSSGRFLVVETVEGFVGSPGREAGVPVTTQRKRRWRGGGGGSYDHSSSPPPSALTMTRAGGGDRHSFKKKGDLPSLVVGAGILVARHRSSIRARGERRKVVVSTGGGGGGGDDRVSHDEEEVAAAGKVGRGVGATVTAASAGLRMGLGESTSRRRAGPGGGGGGGGGGSGGGGREERRKVVAPGPQSPLSSSQGGGAGDDWEEMDEWQDEGGILEAEMDGVDEWTELEQAAEERVQQRGYAPGEQQSQQQRQQQVQQQTQQQHQARRRSVVSPTISSPRTSLEVSLDRTVMPEPVGPLVVWGTAIFAPLGLIAVTARIPRLLGAVRSRVVPRSSPAYKAGGSRGKPARSLLGDLRYSSRLWAGSLTSWGSRRAQQWQDLFGPEEVILPADDWSVCTLLEKTKEGGSFYRYRFGLQSSSNAILPLELGQELTLCGLDTSNQVVQGNYMPLTPRKQRGYFDIVTKDSGALDDSLKSSRSARQFSLFLDKLPLGDEIAVKPGREGLVYGGPDQPITDLVLIATGVGVVPMIQMVNELLPSSTSSVASASVMWLNERTEDFALYGELEKAFFKNHRKLDVSCIVERDLYGNHLEANANVGEAVPKFKRGTLAAVAGPEFFTRKVTDYLMRRGYPEESIINL